MDIPDIKLRCVTATKRKKNKFPMLMMFMESPLQFEAVMDAAMRAGSEILDPAALKKFPRPRKTAITTLGDRKIQIVIDKGNGSCWNFSWQYGRSLDTAWKDLCYDKGGVLLGFLTGDNTSKFLQPGAIGMELGYVMTLCSTVEVFRED